MRQRKGFTLLEILLVIAAIGILAAIVLVAINPNRQLAQARDTARQSDINTLQKALDQYLIETRAYPTSVSTTPGYICNTGVEQVGGGTNCSGRIDLRILVPTYIAGIPRDAQATGNSTGYNVVINPNNNKISVSADLAERKLISINPYMVTNGLVLNLDAGNISSYPGSGTTWTDLSGNGNNGTLINGVGYNAANGGSLTLNGINQEINLGSFFTYQNFTISLWVYPGATQVTYANILDNNHTGNRNFVLQQNASNTNQFAFGVNDATGNISSSSILNLTANTWVNLAFTFTPTDKVIAYVNGVFHSQGSLAGGRTILYNSQILRIGNWGGGGRNWNGNISNFGVYNKVLSATEVSQNFNALRGRYGL